MADHMIIVKTPEVTPRKGGLASVAHFEDNQDRIALGGSLVFDPLWATPVREDIVLCFPAPAGSQPAKARYSNPTGVVEINPFGLYAGVECFLGGDDYEAAALASLDAGESFRIEAKVSEYLMAEASEAGVAGSSVAESIADLEDLWDGNSAWRPVIWMNRGDAALSKSMFRVGSDGELHTINGTPVVATAAIPRGRVAITGSVTVYRSSIEVNVHKDLPSNREFAIAERVYSVALNGPAYINVPGGTP